LTDTQLEIIKYFFENTDCNDTAKRFAEELIAEIIALQSESAHWKNRYYTLFNTAKKGV